MHAARAPRLGSEACSVAQDMAEVMNKRWGAPFFVETVPKRDPLIY